MPLNVLVQSCSAGIRESGFGAMLTVNENYDAVRQKLRYESRYFTANATVNCTNTDAHAWDVGFVQCCDLVRNEAYYHDHATSWDTTGMPRCDCYVHPWYGTGAPHNAAHLGQTGTGKVQVPAGANHVLYQLSMNDNLMSNVPWYDPVPHGTGGAGPFPHALYPVELEQVFREQRFRTYLVSTTGGGAAVWQIHKEIIWNMQISIRFDWSRPLGARKIRFDDHMGTNSFIANPPPGSTLPACISGTPCTGNINIGSVFNGYRKEKTGLIGPLLISA